MADFTTLLNSALILLVVGLIAWMMLRPEKFFKFVKNVTSTPSGTPLIPVEDKFRQLLKDISQIDLEDRCRIIRSVMGQDCVIFISMEGEKFHISAAKTPGLNEL